VNKYKLVIFETNKLDGCMSANKKFYPENTTESQRENLLQKVKEKIGNKYHFNGLHILQPYQKDVHLDVNYQDGTYIKITNKNLTKKDYKDEKLPCDILLIDTKYPNVVIGHIMADCPVIIAEDTKNQVVAISHCGSKQINREVPKYTIEALEKEAKSNPKDIRVYVSSHIKKESYIYDKYPTWATNKKVWNKCIVRKNKLYYINLAKAITNQLIKRNIARKNIKIINIDTYTNIYYYSHTEEVKDNSKDNGQNFVGCFYQKI